MFSRKKIKYLLWFFLIKKVILVLLLLWFNTSFAVNGDNLVTKYYSIPASNSEVYTIPDDYDFVITNLVWSWSIEIFDDTTQLYWGNIISWEYNIICRDEIEITNTSSNSIDVIYTWYLFKEWQNADYTWYSSEDIITIWKELLSSENLFVVFSLAFVWYILIWLLFLCIKWWFKTGVLFYKNKFVVWKK